ncbi:MAG: ribosomal protein S18-alanine N-acetyltransferase [Vicinamibacterales bacterium]|nr:ribosomal protein S18-alanine N-acetyltransferase [Vicinamibacterales bacterium]
MAEGISFVRLTSAGDLDAVLAIDRESFSHPWTRRMYEDDLRQPQSWIWTACRPGGAAMGYCAVWIVLGELHINNVAVGRAWRGRGVGSALVRHAIGVAASLGAASALLEVRRANGEARRMYERLGFSELAVRRAYYDDPPDDALVLMRPIQAVGEPPGA